MKAPQLLSITEAALRLGCSRGHVYDLINAGRIDTVHIGIGKSKARVRECDLAEFIAASTTPRRKSA